MGVDAHPRGRNDSLSVENSPMPRMSIVTVRDQALCMDVGAQFCLFLVPHFIAQAECAWHDYAASYLA